VGHNEWCVRDLAVANAREQLRRKQAVAASRAVGRELAWRGAIHDERSFGCAATQPLLSPIQIIGLH